MAPHDVKVMIEELKSLDFNDLGACFPLPAGSLYHQAVGKMVLAWLGSRLLRQAPEVCYSDTWKRATGYSQRRRKGRGVNKKFLVGLENKFWNPSLIESALDIGNDGQTRIRTKRKNSFAIFDLYLLLIYETCGWPGTKNERVFPEQKVRTFEVGMKKIYKIVQHLSLAELIPNIFGIGGDDLNDVTRHMKLVKRTLRGVGIIELRLSSHGLVSYKGFSKKHLESSNSWANEVVVPLDQRLVRTYYLRRIRDPKDITKNPKTLTDIREVFGFPSVATLRRLNKGRVTFFDQAYLVDFNCRGACNESGAFAGGQGRFQGLENFLNFFMDFSSSDLVKTKPRDIGGLYAR